MVARVPNILGDIRMPLYLDVATITYKRKYITRQLCRCGPFDLPPGGINDATFKTDERVVQRRISISDISFSDQATSASNAHER